jgi:hypothetical protein
MSWLRLLVDMVHAMFRFFYATRILLYKTCDPNNPYDESSTDDEVPDTDVNDLAEAFG